MFSFFMCVCVVCPTFQEMHEELGFFNPSQSGRHHFILSLILSIYLYLPIYLSSTIIFLSQLMEEDEEEEEW